MIKASCTIGLAAGLAASLAIGCASKPAAPTLPRKATTRPARPGPTSKPTPRRVNLASHGLAVTITLPPQATISGGTDDRGQPEIVVSRGRYALTLRLASLPCKALDKATYHSIGYKVLNRTVRQRAYAMVLSRRGELRAPYSVAACSYATYDFGVSCETRKPLADLPTVGEAFAICNSIRIPGGKDCCCASGADVATEDKKSCAQALGRCVAETRCAR